MLHSRACLIAVAATGCIPNLPFTGGAPPPPPVARSADGTEVPPPEPMPEQEQDQEPEPAAGYMKTRSRTVESRGESHTINGRPIADRGGPPPPADGKPRPSRAEIDGIVGALKRMPMVDRHRQLASLIDDWYLTVDQVAVLLGPIPMPDHRRALDVMACSVLDPEHAGDITRAVTPSNASEAVSILTQKCFAKFPHDRRPPGKLARKAAPPPGAYRLPGED